MAPIFIFIILHWYVSLFFQSFFYHRYAAHGLCSMSKGWEKFFQLCSYITHGTSYMSTGSYGIMHRLHHAHTDEAEDPHSPHYSPNALTLMWKTRNSYQDVVQGRIDVDEKYANMIIKEIVNKTELIGVLVTGLTLEKKCNPSFFRPIP